MKKVALYILFTIIVLFCLSNYMTYTNLCKYAIPNGIRNTKIKKSIFSNQPWIKVDVSSSEYPDDLATNGWRLINAKLAFEKDSAMRFLPRNSIDDGYSIYAIYTKNVIHENGYAYVIRNSSGNTKIIIIMLFN